MPAGSPAPGLTAFAAIAGASEAARPTVTLPYDVIRDLPRSAGQRRGRRTPATSRAGSSSTRRRSTCRRTTATRPSSSSSRASTATRWSSINGDFAAQRPNGYTNFYVKADPFLRYGEPNTIRVQARAHRDSRWYTGAGIHRDTQLIVADPVHVALDGVRITTPDIDAERAVVAVATTRGERHARDPHGARRPRGSSTPAARWSPSGSRRGDAAARRERGRPRAALRALARRSGASTRPTCTRRRRPWPTATRSLDEERTTFGIRTLRLDPQHGLRINGETVRAARRLHPPRQRAARRGGRSRAPRSAASRSSRRPASTPSAAPTTRSARPRSTRATASGCW